MQQMSRECYGATRELHLITVTNYNEVKRYCKEIAESLVASHKSVDPAYIYAFAFYYRDYLEHDRHQTPKPISFSKGWDDEPFWAADEFMDRVDEYRKALIDDPHRPLGCNYIWSKPPTDPAPE